MHDPTQPRFEDLLEVPTDFTLRVVALQHESLLGEVSQRVERALGRPPLALEARPSSAGTYLAVQVVVHVTTHAELREVYAVLGELPGLRMVI